MEFLSNYGLFFAKLLSVAFAVAAIFILFFALVAKAKDKGKATLCVKKLNDKYENYHDTLSEITKNKHELKLLGKLRKKDSKEKGKIKNSGRKIFVLNFHGDIKGSAVASLREEITAILTIASSDDEVLVCIDSGGGLVNAYGLASSQLQRIRDANIKLTAAIDKVAASGGYMMACVADRIIAAPFSVIGSIGVIAQLPNFHRYLQKKYIDFEQMSAGEYKRTLSLFGENTKDGRKKMQQELDETQELFKNFVKQHRSSVNIDKIATGEHWYAKRALELNLVDELKTSDDYLLSASKRNDLFQVEYKIKKTFGKRFSSGVSESLQDLLQIAKH